MKTLTNIILLSAGILLSLTGCQKGPDAENSNSDNLVRFSVSTNPETRTVYTGNIQDGKERINWVEGDKIVIWSDNATVRPEGTPKFADNEHLTEYTIMSFQEEGAKSVAEIASPEGNALQYPVENPGSTFWGVYPASAVKASPENNSLPFTIDAEQNIAKNETTTTANNYVPSMDQAIMLAYVTGAKAGKSVDLPFTPAYTDFEFNLSLKEGAPSVTITAMEITSDKREFADNTITPLSGEFTATCTNGTWSYTVASDASNTVKAVLPGEGLTIDEENPLSLNVFALPQDLKNLVVTFYTSEGTKSLKLRNQERTAYITFEGGKKHIINGVILPTGWYFDYITLQLEVLEWEAESASADSNDLPQATQFIVVGAQNGGPDGLDVGDGVKDPYRQQWYFKDGETVSFSYKIMLPVGGRWELEVFGGTEAEPAAFDPDLFEITIPGGTADSEGTVYNISGDMSEKGTTLVEVTITYKGTAGEAHSIFFKSYVYDEAGNKFSIDSETQLYDRGRGYHTFFVNDSHYKN